MYQKQLTTLLMLVTQMGRINRSVQVPIPTTNSACGGRDRIDPNITVESSASNIGEIKPPQPPLPGATKPGIRKPVSFLVA